MKTLFCQDEKHIVASVAVLEPEAEGAAGRSWRRRVVERSLHEAAQRSVSRSAKLIFAAATLMEQTNGDNFTVQEVADLARQSVRTVYVHFDGKDDLLLAVFEEVMNAYTRLVSEAIAVFDDPLERVAAAVYFSSRLTERATSGISVGVARLRARFAVAMPDELARTQAPLTELYARVLREAADTGGVALHDTKAATFVLRHLVEAIGTTRTLGDQFGLDLPDHIDIVEFTLRGLGVEPPPGWQERFERQWAEMPSTFSVGQDLKIAT
jgi:AcrR family transcriptional regulator